MRCRYREVIYYCGKYVESVIYPVFLNKGGRRKKYRPTSDVQARLNEYNSQQHLRRLIETNFSDGDRWVTLTYRNEELPANDKEFLADYRNFLRRLNRRRKNRGLAAAKAICVPEKSVKGRPHFHLIVSGGLSEEELTVIWKKGRVYDRPLEFNACGLEGLAEYITKNPILKKRYLRSGDLKEPEERRREGKLSQGKVRELYGLTDCPEEFEAIYPGIRVTSARAFYNTFNTHFYLRVFGVAEETNRLKVKDRKSIA